MSGLRCGEFPRLGDPLLDEYLRFVAARARPNTVTAQAFDLKVFFAVVGKPPVEVTGADVLAFIAEQRAPRRGDNVRRLVDGDAGLSARTVKRRRSSVSGLFTFLVHARRRHCEPGPPRSGDPPAGACFGAVDPHATHAAADLAVYAAAQPAVLPGTDEGRHMRHLRAETNRRMLSNGYCTRPAELDCRFETICESCTFFATTIELRPTLQAQRDDAASKRQTARKKIFDGLIQRLDDNTP